MKTGPHRKLQLLGATTNGISQPAGSNTQATIDSADNTPRASLKPKSAANTYQIILSSNGQASSTPTAATTKSQQSKTPTKKAETVTSPRMANQTAQPKHNLRSSFSTNQLTYTIISAKEKEPSTTTKSFQPVLLKKGQIDLTAVGPMTGGHHHGNSRTPSLSSNPLRKSSASFTQLADKVNNNTNKQNKSGSKPVIIKEQPFNYEERNKSADHMLNGKTAAGSQVKQIDEETLKDVQKQLSNQLSGQFVSHKAIGQEVQIVEVFKDDPNLHLNIEDRDEVRMRPSDEVSMNNEQQLLFALGSGFTHSRIGSGQNWGDYPRRFDTNNNSYRVLIEENKSDTKGGLDHDYGAIDEKFEVIREDTKDSFYSPSYYDNRRDNSDFKKFTADDEQANHMQQQNSIMESRWLQKHQLEPFGGHSIQHEFKTPEHQNNISSANPVLTLGQTEETAGKEGDQFEETPKNIKERAKQLFFDPQPSNDNAASAAFNSNNSHNQMLISHNFPGAATMNFQGFTDQNSVPMPQNQAHVLSFSEDNPTYNRDITSAQNQNKDFLLQSLNFDDKSLIEAHKQTPLTNANTIIEIEKNYVIQQYETLLQQLSTEFQKVLTKTKETDEHVAQQEILIQTQKKIIEEREATIFQQEQLNQQLQQQQQDLIQDMQMLAMERSRREEAESQNEAQLAQREMLEQNLQTLQSKLRLYESQEICYKDQIEQLQVKVRICETRLRVKEEEVFQAQRMTAAYERDLGNIKEVHNSLMMEIQRGTSQRLAVEEQIQEMRQRASGDQMLLRVKESEIENASRECKQLRGTLDTLQHSLTQVMRENDQLKSALNEQERSGIQMKSLFQSRDTQMQQIEQDNEKLRSLIDKERQTSMKLEENLRVKIDQLQTEMRDLRQQRELDLISQQNQRSFDNNPNGVQRQNAANFQDTIVVNSAGRQSLNDFHPKQLLSPNRSIDEQPPLKSNINWLYQKPQEQSLLNPAINVQPKEDGNIRRKTVMNQNNSQLHDVLAWSEGAQQPPHSANNYKSLERQPPLSQQQYFAGNAMPPQGKSLAALNQNFSPRAMQQPVAGKFAFPEEAAGKKSNTDTSPFTATQETVRKQTNHLQNTLSTMQIDKERMENEYRKLGTSKNKMQIERKKELEFEIEVINKNIHQVKQKLREFNAF